MPGRTPTEAFRAFIGPIQGAAGCLGRVKVVPSPGGSTEPRRVHAWTLNGAVGVTSLGWHLEAQMHYEIVPHEERWRVTTRAYRYRLAFQGQDLWRLHWHPGGKSDVTYPHLHPYLGGVPEGTDSLAAHLPMGRATFEDAIRWAAECGYPMVRHDWKDVLAITEQDHLRYRSWGGTPPG